jgi:hypothetical protein
MTARHLRESPRMIAAGAVTAVVLVLIGVLIGSTTASGGTSSPSRTSPPRHPDARQAAELRVARQTIAGLRSELTVAGQRARAITTQLTNTRARVRCWRTAALHHSAARVSKCAART